MKTKILLYILLTNAVIHKSQATQPVKPFSSFGIQGVISTPSTFNNGSKNYFKTSFLQINYERYFVLNSSKRPLYIGVGTSFRLRHDYGDSFSYRSRQYTIDLLHRFYLNKRFNVKIGISPIVESRDMIRSNIKNINNNWSNYISKIYQIQSYFSIGIGCALSENFEGHVAYQYLPTAFGNKRIQMNYLGYALQFKFF